MRTRFPRLVLYSAAFAAAVTLWMTRSGSDADAAPSAEPLAATVPQESPQPMVLVLAAAGDLATGAHIGPQDLTSVALPPLAIPPEALTDTAENRAYLEGRLALRDLPRLTPLSRTDASRVPQPVTPARLVRANMRAMAIPVTPESAVAGLVAPGDHVDVILTFRLEDGTSGSRAVLRNTRVLAVDRAVERPDTAPADPPQTITLELTPEAATALALATDLGKLSVTLSGDVSSDAPESELLSVPPMTGAQMLALGGPEPSLADQMAAVVTRAEPVTATPAAPVPVEVSVVRGSVTARAQVLPSPARPAAPPPAAPPAPAQE